MTWHRRAVTARALKGEKLKLNMNDYMEIKFPKAFEISRKICDEVGRCIHRELDDVEIGYLAMHIERVASDEIESMD